ncbi:restriction endonuclease subunit S [Comamonas terrae]|uniref:Restriction endonuclease subunit S n=1 Tax=Comamonas terrae TaxID=673548 RepID=A0ABW5UNK4_9BURK|nr:restriction endonuclease subunit S [Comamonas terrae]
MHLADIAQLNPKLNKSTIQEKSLASFVPMACVSEVSGSIISEEEREIEAISKGFTYFQNGDILVAKITPCFENGKIALAHVKHEHAFGSTEFHVIRPDATKVDGRYLFHFLRQPRIRIEGEKRMTGSGGQRRVPKSFLEELEISLPSLPEQRRIAAILDKAEALRSKRRKAIAKLDQLLQSVFLEMFGDPVTNSKNWPLKSFLEVGQWKSGATPSKSNSDYWIGSYPWVSPKDMKVDHIDDSQDHLNEEVFAKTSLKKIDPNHILIVVRGMILAHSFPVAINNVSIAINQDMKAIEPNSDFSSKYLISCIKSLKQRFLSVVSSAGHGTKRLDLRDAAEISIPMPDISLQKKFDDIYDKVKIQKKNLIQQETKLQEFISSIQYKYFQ